MDYQKNIKKNIIFGIKLLILIKVLRSIVLYYTTQPLYLRVYILSYNQQQVQQYVPERYNNIIHKLFLRSKKTIKATLNSITRIRLIIYIKDPKEAPNIDYTHIKNTEAEKTLIVNIITTSHPIKSNAIFTINLDASQVSIQQKRDNKHILNINNMPNMQESKKLY